VSVLIVTGTGTGVGKTIVTAAVATLAAAAHLRVTVIKPAQTGVRRREPGDLEVVHALVPAVDTVELARFPDPLSPEAAARLAGLPPLDPIAVVDAAHEAALESDLVLIEGAGGLLVQLGHGVTLADIARRLDAPVLVVTEPGLGTLNATALTLEALKTRELSLAGVVIGAWPASPGLAERSNIGDLETLLGGPLGGALDADAAGLDPAGFADLARRGLGPLLRGTFDAQAFRARHSP
jgi:dethiobiotin synthetase